MSFCFLGQDLVDCFARRIAGVVDQVSAPGVVDGVNSDLFFQVLTEFAHQRFPLLVELVVAIRSQRDAILAAVGILQQGLGTTQDIGLQELGGVDGLQQA